MKCPFCTNENQTSRLTPDAHSTGTCMASSPGYYDESGKWVPGCDPNWYTRGYSCSRGHRYTVTRRDGHPDEVTLVSTLAMYPPAGASGAISWSINVGAPPSGKASVTLPPVDHSRMRPPTGIPVPPLKDGTA